MNFNLRAFALWVIVVLIMLAVFTLFQNPEQRSTLQDISFSQLLSDVDQGKVREVVIQGPEIQATYKDGRNFKTYAPNDPTLATRLHGKGIIITARPSQDIAQWLVSLLVSWLPFFFLIGVWIFLSRQMQSGKVLGFGQRAVASDKDLADPKHWRDRASEARALAERLADPQSKRQMLEIARSYEYLAQRAVDRPRGSEI